LHEKFKERQKKFTGEPSGSVDILPSTVGWTRILFKPTSATQIKLVIGEAALGGS
jgi:hypothetical protein